MLDSKDHPDQQPITPPPHESELPVTPQQCRSTPVSPPPHTSAIRIANHPVSLDLLLLGGFNEHIQRAQLLHEMDHVPWQSVQVPVPNLRYFNLDNMAIGRQLSNAELLAVTYIGRDPASYAEAMRSENMDMWTKVCQYEIDALQYLRMIYGI